jgi:DNA anti-recombination protein RmuC
MILLSYEGKKIETKSKEVFRMLRAIQKDYEKTNEALQVLGKHINNTYNQYNAKVMQNFSLMGQKLTSTQSLPDTKPKQEQLESEL